MKTVSKNTMYALIEGGHIHTSDLTLNEAKEMLDRHSRIFDTIKWDICPMSEAKDKERLKGYLELQRDIAVKYFQP